MASTRTVVAAEGGTVDPDSPLANARRLAEELRFEEAVVEYQRFLAQPELPTAERARATFELAFIQLVLGDERSAQMRAQEALELDPSLRLPDDAPAREQKFFKAMRADFESRTRLEVLPPGDPDAPQRIRARLVDPRKKAHAVMLRHALSANGPYFGQRMNCVGEICEAEIPLPRDTQALSVWYYVEANDAEGNTIARSGNTTTPLRVSIVARDPWYRSPWVYAGGAAAIVAAAAVFFVASE
ncbi:MAG: hypothetical protein IRZ16_14695 [Myxococcaceae bacterium]|nr:hypothetical protein [Myxococcaceae bacterium]